jgi:hypothetical protein
VQPQRKERRDNLENQDRDNPKPAPTAFTDNQTTANKALKSSAEETT